MGSTAGAGVGLAPKSRANTFIHPAGSEAAVGADMVGSGTTAAPHVWQNRASGRVWEPQAVQCITSLLLPHRRQPSLQLPSERDDDQRERLLVDHKRERDSDAETSSTPQRPGNDAEAE